MVVFLFLAITQHKRFELSQIICMVFLMHSKRDFSTPPKKSRTEFREVVENRWKRDIIHSGNLRTRTFYFLRCDDQKSVYYCCSKKATTYYCCPLRAKIKNTSGWVVYNSEMILISYELDMSNISENFPVYIENWISDF